MNLLIKWDLLLMVNEETKKNKIFRLIFKNWNIYLDFNKVLSIDPSVTKAHQAAHRIKSALRALGKEV